MYEFIFEKMALKDLNKLDLVNKKRIWNKLQDCKIDPFRYVESLVEIKGFKLRVGDYRIIMDIENKLKVLNILKVGHRKKIYER